MGRIPLKTCCSCSIEQSLDNFYVVQGKPYPRCKICDRKRKQTERKLKDHSSIDRKHSLKKLYRLTPEEYISLFDLQKGRCSICYIHQSQLDYHLVVDHCHRTKKIRGLLCRKCNFALGLLEEDLDRFDRCKEYLNGK